MTRMATLTATATLAVILLAPAAAVAQRPLGYRPPGPVPSPTVSPYLNLLRRGTPPAVNYYGLVRPAQQMTNNLQYLQQQIDANRTLYTEQTGADTGLPFTGKTVSFQNTYGYFMNLSPTGIPSYGTLGGGTPGLARPMAGTTPLSGPPQGTVTRPLPPRR